MADNATITPQGDLFGLQLDAVSSPVRSDVRCELAEKATLARTYKVLLAFIPLVIVFQGILGFRLSSRYVAPFAMLVTIVLGAAFFADSAAYANDSLETMMGRVFLLLADRLLWTVFSYAGNMLSALFFLEVLKRWGIVESIRRGRLVVGVGAHGLELALAALDLLAGARARGGLASLF